MYTQQFKKLIALIDKEIEAYSKLKDLFEEKKELLKKAKADDLGVLDNKILALNDSIVKLNNARKSASIELIGKDGCMSDFISFAEVNQPDQKEALLLRKDKICNNFEQLALLNNQNVELIKHGITITNKMLETIVNAFAPQGSIYNGAGKTTDTHDLDMWTINEEI
ncbi:MAG: flagellar protein FlgN [Cyanobacteria bacterium SIG32]|nr:flagellar protein FlgN [Cyanobacteria bacterium SIG32]